MRYPSLLIILIFTGSCQPMDLETVGETYLDLPSVRYNYNNFNDTTNAISTLGRVLFYDRQLSINNTVSCASCHKQSAAFADNERFSRGFEGKLTSRNSMPIQNVDFFGGVFFAASSSKPALIDPPISSISSSFFPQQQHLFWDGRETSLERLILQPVGNHIEMGIRDVDALSAKLSAVPYYQSLFTEAFQTQEVTPDKISTAIATFLRSIRSNPTRFDQHNMRNVADVANIQPVLSPLELEGMMLFDQKYKCNSCHQVTSPIGYIFAGTFANIGLDKVYADNGLQKVTGNAADAGKFKIPSLRNVSYTAPYMHDGRFETLEDVINHYSEGMADNPNLDVKMRKDGTAQSMNISKHETQAIIAFLRTLDDQSLLSDPRFSNPFKTR